MAPALVISVLLSMVLVVLVLWWSSTTPGGEGSGETRGIGESSGSEDSPGADQRTGADPNDGVDPTDGASSADETQQVRSPGPRTSATIAPEKLFAPVSEASQDPDSIHVLVNARNPLVPLDHSPSDLVQPAVPTPHERVRLREEPAEALEMLITAATEEGMNLSMTSGYRSYELQEQIYDEQVAALGQEAADALVARPGHSEHQSGLAVDLYSEDQPGCIATACFGDTPEGLWLEENAAEFGFIIRYPEGAEDITGISYEPWHLRYLGEETALAVHEADLTLEEFWGEPAAPDYPDHQP